MNSRMIDDIVKQARSIAVSGHIKPDGDCTGSVLALYNYLKRWYPEKETDVYLEFPGEKYRLLKNFDQIRFSCDTEKQYDLMITLDCSTLERLGDAVRYFHGAGHTVCLDHHVSNEGYAEENFVDGDASSACEVLFRFLDPAKLDADIAACLYAGIISDTGVFKYPSTSPETLRVAAHLMEYGIRADELIDELFSARYYNENRILGYALMNSRLELGGKVICAFITREDMERFQVSSRELEGIVPQLRLTRGVLCAVFLYETGENRYKVSLRSVDPFDVNRVASAFGGGGHVRAAGCNVAGELPDCLEAILLEVKKTL